MQLATRKQLSKKNPWRIENRDREYELIHFCRQYGAWKRRIKDIRLKCGSGEWDNPTEEEAVEIATCREKIDLVEKLVAQVVRKETYLYPFILLHVTENVSYPALRTYHDMIYPRDPFYDLVHEFYYLLDKERH